MKKETLDWPRIIHILKIGILASVMVLTGDMLLGWFLFPATIIFAVFFFLTAIMRITGDHALTNALATGWISIWNLWMMGGLLIEIKKVAG